MMLCDVKFLVSYLIDEKQIVMVQTATKLYIKLTLKFKILGVLGKK